MSAPNRGKEAEARFFAVNAAAIEQGLFPAWIVGVEKSTKSEDTKGVDYWFRTVDTDRLPLDVKCSRNAAINKRKQLRRTGTWKRQKRHYIRVVLVTVDTSDEAIVASTIRNLEIARRRWLKERQEKQQARITRLLRRFASVDQSPMASL